MRPDTGQNSKNRDFVIQREFNIMTQRAMILLQYKTKIDHRNISFVGLIFLDLESKGLAVGTGHEAKCMLLPNNIVGLYTTTRTCKQKPNLSGDPFLLRFEKLGYLMLITRLPRIFIAGS